MGNSFTGKCTNHRTAYITTSRPVGGRAKSKGAQALNQRALELSLFFLFLFIYDSHTERERGRDIGRGRSRLHAPEPDVGFDPGSPGSRPGPKAGSKPLHHPGIPHLFIFAFGVKFKKSSPRLMSRRLPSIFSSRSYGLRFYG